MNGRREEEELVRLWQELQVAQVAGDARRLEELRRRAEAESGRPDASEEWQLLEREAGRHAEQLHEAVEAQPSVGVDGEAVPVDVESAPEPVGGRSGPGKGSLIWLLILVGWVVLQIVQGVGGENGSP
jgi:hypothetical protein